MECTLLKRALFCTTASGSETWKMVEGVKLSMCLTKHHAMKTIWEILVNIQIRSFVCIFPCPT